jgi:hypothetical protein
MVGEDAASETEIEESDFRSTERSDGQHEEQGTGERACMHGVSIIVVAERQQRGRMDDRSNSDANDHLNGKSRCRIAAADSSAAGLASPRLTGFRLPAAEF